MSTFGFPNFDSTLSSAANSSAGTRSAEEYFMDSGEKNQERERSLDRWVSLSDGGLTSTEGNTNLGV